jgi:Zn-dependent peptidase ImmA (M78 family)
MMIEKIESEAERLLSKLGITEVPVPIEEVAHLLGLRIRRAPSTEFSGLLLRKDGKALIGVNSSEAAVRQRFTIAHEIGHFVLHPQKDAFVDFRKSTGPPGEVRPPRERHADMFAAALLMPRKALLKDFRRLGRDIDTDNLTKTLSRCYFVSEDAMRFRLINLNALGAK